MYSEYSHNNSSPHSFHAVFLMTQELLYVSAGDTTQDLLSLAELKTCSGTTSSALDTTYAVILYAILFSSI